MARAALHFFGTSNQRTSDAALACCRWLPDCGLQNVVTEHAPRLDYFEALRVLRDSTAVLLMGSRERHYTPSKVFPALVAKRPVFRGIARSQQRVGPAAANRACTHRASW